ncbi:MAG TPA: efflux RND transporter periplasmic adaptor subunit [Candidatus Acidoferrales bacterium]|jgi:cobalt-zinc-cadmium efflux system membrane fusion protein
MSDTLHSFSARAGAGAIYLALIFSVGISGCSSAPPTPEPAAATSNAEGIVYVPSDPRGIHTASAELKQIPVTLELAGRIEPDPTSVTPVFPPVGGRVIRIEVRPGEAVARGQILAVLESSDVTSARMDYRHAIADAEVKGKQRERAADLFSKGALAEKDAQQADADAKMADAEVSRTLDRLRVLDVDPAGTTNEFKLLAPHAGVVLDVGAAQGEFSKSLDAPRALCTLADLSTVWAVGEIYEKDIEGLKVGQQASVAVSAYGNKKWAGRVAAIADALDPVSRTLSLRVVLPNPERTLKPEMFATISLVRSVSPTIVIPASAVIREGSSSFVYVQRNANQFEKREVTLGASESDRAEVEKGLKAGDVIVTEGALLLRAAGASAGQ